MKKSVIFLFFFTVLSVHLYADEWKEYKKEHFIILYKNAPIDFVKEVERTAETYYQEITRNLGFIRYKGWTWDERAKIYIYNDSDDYVGDGRQMGWSHGAASPKSKIIRTFPSAHGFFDSTLPHELGHLIFREFIGFQASVPAWFEEGIAMFQEKAKRWGADQDVIKAVKQGKFIPLDELSLIHLSSQSDQELVNLFYAESASAVHFFISEYGLNRFVQLCRKLQEGGTFELALSEVYVRFKDVQDLNKAWVIYLSKVKE